MPRCLPVVLLLSASIGAAFAQTSGEIAGEVRDQSGAVAPNASVTATNTATNVSRSTLTNSAGVYSFPNLTPGPYQVKATATGFAASAVNLQLQVQQTARIDFTLTVGSASQTLEVSAGAETLNTDNATVGAVIEEKRINELPLNGRNFFSLVALSPNVSYGFTPAQQASARLGCSRTPMPSPSTTAAPSAAPATTLSRPTPAAAPAIAGLRTSTRRSASSGRCCGLCPSERDAAS